MIPRSAARTVGVAEPRVVAVRTGQVPGTAAMQPCIAHLAARAPGRSVGRQIPHSEVGTGGRLHFGHQTSQTR